MGSRKPSARSPTTHLSFPRTDLSFPIRHIFFPIRRIIFPIRRIIFPIRRTISPDKANNFSDKAYNVSDNIHFVFVLLLCICYKWRLPCKRAISTCVSGVRFSHKACIFIGFLFGFHQAFGAVHDSTSILLGMLLHQALLSVDDIDALLHGAGNFRSVYFENHAVAPLWHGVGGYGGSVDLEILRRA